MTRPEWSQFLSDTAAGLSEDIRGYSLQMQRFLPSLTVSDALVIAALARSAAAHFHALEDAALAQADAANQIEG